MRINIHELCDDLNRLKGYEAGYTTGNDTELMLQIGNRLYKASLEDKGEIEGKLKTKHIKEYL